MKRFCMVLLAAVLSVLLAFAALADELPEGVEIQRVGGAGAEETVEEPDAPEEQPLPTPAMEAAPINAAPQTGDRSGTLLALTGLGFSLATLAMARRLKENT